MRIRGYISEAKCKSDLSDRTYHQISLPKELIKMMEWSTMDKVVVDTIKVGIDSSIIIRLEPKENRGDVSYAKGQDKPDEAHAKDNENHDKDTKEHSKALKDIARECDNRNPTHENIRRIAKEALKD